MAEPFLDALLHQRQLDQDGVMVGVSRQAVDETLTFVATLRAQLAVRDAEVARLEAQLKAEAERADYAWRNTRLIEKDRQELLERLKSSEARCKLLEQNVPPEGKVDD